MRPTPADLRAARDRVLPDVLADGLSVVGVGVMRMAGREPSA